MKKKTELYESPACQELVFVPEGCLASSLHESTIDGYDKIIEENW